MNEPAIGVIGGRGLYHLEGLTAQTLHAVETPKAVESTRTLSVTADYRLSEAGRKASLLSGGNGQSRGHHFGHHDASSR